MAASAEGTQLTRRGPWSERLAWLRRLFEAAPRPQSVDSRVRSAAVQTSQCDELPLSPDPESVCSKSGGGWARLGRDLDALPLLRHRARLLLGNDQLSAQDADISTFLSSYLLTACYPLFRSAR